MSTDVATYIGPLIKVKLNNEIVVVEKKCCINSDCNQVHELPRPEGRGFFLS